MAINKTQLKNCIGVLDHPSFDTLFAHNFYASPPVIRAVRHSLFASRAWKVAKSLERGKQPVNTTAIMRDTHGNSEASCSGVLLA